MTDLNSELAWEQNMLNFGVDRFRAQERNAKDRGDFTGTNGGRRLLKSYLSQVSEFIAHYCAGNGPGGRRRSKYTPIIEQVDPDVLAMITLTCVVEALFKETDMVGAARVVGSRIEAELKFSKFNEEHDNLFKELQRDLDRRNSSNYRHRHRVLTHAMNKKGVDWKPWDEETRISVGLLLLSLAMDASDLVTKKTVRHGNKSKVLLDPRPEVLEWIEKSDDALAAALPDRMPTLIRPEEWTTYYDGGYHLPRLRSSTALVKFRRGRAGRAHREIMRDAEMPAVTRAVNGMQNTAWRINTRVLAAAQAVWDSNLGIGMPPVPAIRGSALAHRQR